MVSLIFNPDLFEFYFKKNYGIDRILRPDSAIFAFLFFQLFDNHKKLLDTLIKISLIYFIFTVVIELIPAIKAGYWTDIGADGNQIKLTYNLSFGYKLTFPTILFIYSFVFQKKKIFLLNSIIGFLLILIYGNRGAILVILIYIFLILLSLLEKYSLPKKILLISSLIVLSLLLIHYLDSIILFFANVLERFNINSRTLRLLAYGRISEDNGRDIIWDLVIDAIKQGGILGYGILGDRPFVSPIHYVGYSHNIFLELVVSFGIFGYFVILYLIIDAIKMIFFCKNKYSKQLYIIFFSVACQLLLSMSFWFVWEFWAMLAISFSYKRMEKEKNKVRLVDRFERNYKKK
ncbi:MAG: O-antigen ligase family protein [Peptoniphilaceae bacterium]|nr:O-antigen ligase family protein [Peptoniphilaceae bacterium]MDY3737904.1 O-antigen ligase family protein [Peptoniphilaceae bacterium]